MEGKVATLYDVLSDSGSASIILQHLDSWEKRRLRFALKGGRDAIDRTVNTVTFCDQPDESYVYLSKLVNSNWREEVTTITYKPWHRIRGTFIPPPTSCITQIAEAGFSRLQSLRVNLVAHDEDEVAAEKVIGAGWNLKELCLGGSGPSPKWLLCIIRGTSHWPLEYLGINNCTDEIAALISMSEWGFKHLDLGFSEWITHEGIQNLMQGEWVTRVEVIDWLSIDINDKMAIAIAEGSHRAVNLVEFNIEKSIVLNNGKGFVCTLLNLLLTTVADHIRILVAAFLLLSEGSYPSLRRLKVKGATRYQPEHVPEYNGVRALLMKCPVLESCQLFSVTGIYWDHKYEDMCYLARKRARGVLQLTVVGDMIASLTRDYRREYEAELAN